MGYTHYWRGPLTASRSLLLADVRKLISSTPIKIAGPSGSGQPVIAEDCIAFNGSGDDDAHESVRLALGSDIPFGFCKTARKPYDDVVGAVLLRCAFYNDGFKVSSDGSWEEWLDARKLYQQAFGSEPRMPEEMEP